MESMTHETLEKIKKLQVSIADLGSISVMPDYFVDRFIKIKSFDELAKAIKLKGIDGGGGSIRGISQFDTRGGNAVNVGFALSAMGARVRLYAIANGLAARVLQASLENHSNLKLETIEGRNGITTAFEFQERSRIVNVMVSDVGDLQNFDGTSIKDWSGVENSEVIAVLNWAANESGTELCKRAFSRRKKGSKSFFDPADLSAVVERLPEFKKQIIDEGLLDVTSINDNEARFICRAMAGHNLPHDYSVAELSFAVRKIQDAFGSTVDVHTRNFSISCSARDEIYEVPCHRVDQKIVTGAGDVWDSADVIGYLGKMEPRDRLVFANAAAGLYVSRAEATSPTLSETISFLESEIALIEAR